MKLLAYPKISNPTLIKMLSPCTIYSTYDVGGKSQVYYYKPYEEQFSTLIRANAIKKYKAFLSLKNERYSEKSIDNMKLSIVPANFSIRKNKKIMYFKDTVICAYIGIFQLSGDPELIWITYESGLGGKNSQGFGMWSVYDPRASKADEVLEALSVK